MNKISTGAAIAMLSSPGLAAALMADSNLELRIYAGAVPASADAATGSATMLVAIKTGGATGLNLQMTGAVLSKPSADPWQGSVVASGRATFYRLVKGGDANDLSVTVPRIQGSVAQVGADVNLASVDLITSAPQDLKDYVLSIVEAAA